jgi:hypothetical protein
MRTQTYNGFYSYKSNSPFFLFAFMPKPIKIKTLKKITDIGIIYVLPLASPQILKVEKQKSLSIFTGNLD